MDASTRITNDHPCIQGAKQQMQNTERWQDGNANPGPVEHAPGGRRLTAKGKATRQRIISAASHAFRARRDGDSNDNILAVAGAATSQLYHYFTDRDDLVAAVIADRVGRSSATKIPSLTSTASRAYDSGVTPSSLAHRKTASAETDA